MGSYRDTLPIGNKINIVTGFCDLGDAFHRLQNHCKRNKDVRCISKIPIMCPYDGVYNDRLVSFLGTTVKNLIISPDCFNLPPPPSNSCNEGNYGERVKNRG